MSIQKEEEPVVTVPVLNSTYSDYCQALRFMISDWINDFCSSDLYTSGNCYKKNDIEKKRILKVNELNGIPSPGNICDQPKSVKDAYNKLLDHKILNHFDIVVSHRYWIARIYAMCVYVGIDIPLSVKDAIDVHDLSKFSHQEALGYALRFGTSDAGIFGTLKDPAHQLQWINALDNHYHRNPHHPEYFYPKDSKTGERKKHESIIRMFPDEANFHLTESLLDMLAANAERSFYCHTELNLDLVFDLKPGFFDRYHEEDAESVKGLLREWKRVIENFYNVEENKNKLHKFFDNRNVIYKTVQQ